MAKLEYTFKTDTLFKMIFVKYPDLLKRLVAELLGKRIFDRTWRGERLFQIATNNSCQYGLHCLRQTRKKS